MRNSFFVSPSNRKAYQVVSQFNREKAPPVTLVCGAQGSGKTALLSVLKAELVAKQERPLFIDASDFSCRFACAAQKNFLPSFRRSMRSGSLLLCDNLDRICGKEKSLEELFFTCEEIWRKGGHVIATLNRESLIFEGFGPRLASRLCLGFCVHIEKPSLAEIGAFLEWRGKGNAIGQCTMHNGRLGENEPENGAEFFRGWHFGQIARYLDGWTEKGGSDQRELILGNFQEIAENMMAISQRYFHIGEDELRGPSRGVEVVRLRTVQYYILWSQGYTQREIAAYYRQSRPSVARRCAVMKEDWQSFEEMYEFVRSKLVIDTSSFYTGPKASGIPDGTRLYPCPDCSEPFPKLS